MDIENPAPLDEQDKEHLHHVIEHLIDGIGKVSMDPTPEDLVEFGENLDMARFIVSGIIYSTYEIGFVEEEDED